MDKKNTLLLTVIAIATLLVAVVGATFAYFTAQRGEGQNANVNVKTSTTDTLTFDTKPIFLMATQQNFADVSSGEVEENVGSQKAVSTSTVEFKKGGPGSTDYCYNATVKITSNNFEYAPDQTNFGTDPDRPDSQDYDHAPELLLKITKKTTKSTESGSPTTIIYNQDIDSVKYESLTSQRRVCTQTNTTDPTGNDITYSEPACADNQTVEGLDITILNNQAKSNTTSEIKIPTEVSGTKYQHKLSGASEGDTIKDEWTAELVFVNYNWDQQYNASPNGGEQKKLNATFEFKRVDCTEE